MYYTWVVGLLAASVLAQINREPYTLLGPMLTRHRCIRHHR
jgi:hypothetical protein